MGGRNKLWRSMLTRLGRRPLPIGLRTQHGLGPHFPTAPNAPLLRSHWLSTRTTGDSCRQVPQYIFMIHLALEKAVKTIDLSELVAPPNSLCPGHKASRCQRLAPTLQATNVQTEQGVDGTMLNRRDQLLLAENGGRTSTTSARGESPSRHTPNVRLFWLATRLIGFGSEPTAMRSCTRIEPGPCVRFGESVVTRKPGEENCDCPGPEDWIERPRNTSTNRCHLDLDDR